MQIRGYCIGRLALFRYVEFMPSDSPVVSRFLVPNLQSSGTWILTDRGGPQRIIEHVYSLNEYTFFLLHEFVCYSVRCAYPTLAWGVTLCK